MEIPPKNVGNEWLVLIIMALCPKEWKRISEEGVYI